MRKTSRAEEYYRRVLASQPKIHPARRLLADLLIARRDYPEAERELDKLISAAPENPRDFQALGLVLLELEQFDDALAAFEGALAIDPDLPGLQDNLNITRQQMENRRD